jgi:hypothetical protein
MVRLQTRTPSFSSSPRILSAPHSRLSFAICLIKAMVSAATFGLWEEVFDLRFHYRRKSSRCHREPRLWLHNHEGGLSGTNQPGQQDEEHAIGPADGWPFHLSPENDELVSEKRGFRDELGLASAQIGKGGERQGGQERFGPTSKARGERMQAAILQPLERGKNTGQKKSSPSHESVVVRA